MLTQENAIDLSKKFIEDLKEAGYTVQKAYLYGSYLINQQNEYSDIDVAVVADEFTGFSPVDIKPFLNILRKYRLIHAKTYSTEDLTNGEPFLDEIVKKGKEIN